MATSKKTGGKQTKAKERLIILALYPKPVGLSDKEIKALERALKAAAETSVESHENLEAVVVPVSEGS